MLWAIAVGVCLHTVLLGSQITIANRVPVEKLHCDVFNANCDSSTEKCDFDAQICESSPGVNAGCYALWQNDSHGITLIYKGCWSTVADCVNGEECFAVAPHSRTTTYFCCCTASRCNERFAYAPHLANKVAQSEGSENVVPAPLHWFSAVVFALTPICALAVIILFSYWLYRRCRFMRYEASNEATIPVVADERLFLQQKTHGQFSQITLIDVKARGRFGCVWRAVYNSNIVAVKSLPFAEEESWLKEQEIYSVPGMRSHPNILLYFGAQCFPAHCNAELWLITAYHERGSLHDYLKANELTTPDSFKIAVGMLRGLAFLHEELATPDGFKSTIVHRDFKSRNVLLTDSLDACIADFGLSLKCEFGTVPNEIHAQVGTHRYLSPEILEGATEFTAFAFRQTDCYAAALVLWEIVSRCRFCEEKCSEYRLPYEEEVGLVPDLAAMQECVVDRRYRPKILTAWRQHTLLSVFCMTMEEMWDSESDARITAGCACERLDRVSRTESNKSDLYAQAQALETLPFLQSSEPLEN